MLMEGKYKNGKKYSIKANSALVRNRLARKSYANQTI